MPSSLPRARAIAALACLAGAGTVPALAMSTTAVAATASAPSLTASAAGSCSFSARKKGGYFQSLKVSGVSCSKGKSVAKHHDACRLKNGVKGYCKKVDGYSCTEKRNSTAVELDGRVTCKKGSKKVVYTYSQDIA